MSCKYDFQDKRTIVFNLAMKIQLSPVIISPSMYFPLPLPHIPTKTSTMVNNGLLATDQTDKRLPIQPILPISS